MSDKVIRYEVSPYDSKPVKRRMTPAEFQSRTEGFRRIYVETWEDAVSWYINNASEKVDRAINDLNSEHRRLKRVNLLPYEEPANIRTVSS